MGQSPEIIWWTDNETGDLTDWNNGGYVWNSNSGSSFKIATSPSPVRSGKYSLCSSVTSTGVVGTQAGAEAFRNSGLPPEAYYSAWYYFPAAVTAPTTYWLFFKFRSRTGTTSDAPISGFWDLDVDIDSTGAMYLALYNHNISSDVPLLSQPAIPIGRWFQVEVFLRAATDTTGELAVWFDGTQIADVTGQTAYSSYVDWAVGGVGEVLSPSQVTMYIDDAAISTQRLGPDFPVFWRGN
jgi:hypothetical protein